MESRIIKFRLIHKGKIFGYERLTDKGWESMCPFLNPEGGERWTPVVFSNSIEGVRQQFTGLTDKNGKEIYEGDIAKVHLFIEELGMNFGVIEGEREYMGVIEFWQYGIALNVGDSENNFYLTLSPGMLHEESFDIIGNKFEHPELLHP